jgi:hypothetical protein
MVFLLKRANKNNHASISDEFNSFEVLQWIFDHSSVLLNSTILLENNNFFTLFVRSHLFPLGTYKHLNHFFFHFCLSFCFRSPYFTCSNDTIVLFIILIKLEEKNTPKTFHIYVLYIRYHKIYIDQNKAMTWT